MVHPQTLLEFEQIELAASPVSAAELQVVEFRLGSINFAVPIGTVQEIIRFEGASPLTGMPIWTLGVVNLRGTIVQMHDLGARIGMRDVGTAATDTAKALVLRWQEKVVGLVVDDVEQVAVISADDLSPAPTGADRFVANLAMSAERLVMVLDVQELAQGL